MVRYLVPPALAVPSIYQHYSDQVAALYICDVTPNAHDWEVRQMVESLWEQSIDMLLCQATRHAVEKDFIRSEALKFVEKAQRESKERGAQ